MTMANERPSNTVKFGEVLVVIIIIVATLVVVAELLHQLNWEANI